MSDHQDVPVVIWDGARGVLDYGKFAITVTCRIHRLL
jgi:hypothetical protein